MSIKGDFGYEPENRVALTGRVKFVSKMIPTRSGVPFVGFTVDVPRLNGVFDSISCTAFEDNATEICEHVAEGDVIHVEGSLRVYKSETVGCSVRVSEWWLDDGKDEFAAPDDPEERAAELERLEAERVRQAMAIDGILPPEDMTAWEDGAWVSARLHGAEWEKLWKEGHGIEAANDERIGRIYALLRDHWRGVEAGSDADPRD